MLAELKARGVPTGILSNGDPEMLGVAVKSAGFSGLLAHVISVHALTPLQDRPGDLRARHAGAEPACEGHPVRLEQRLGRDRRDLVRLHDAVGQPLRCCRSNSWTPNPRAPARSLRDVLDFFPASMSNFLSSRTDHEDTLHAPQFTACRSPPTLHTFIEKQVLPGTGIDAASTSGRGFDAIVAELAPKNAALLAERDRLQSELDAWHKKPIPGPVKHPAKYRAFLTKIGYLVPVPPVVKATTKNVDAELSRQAGPQLVVPITNARYALNAANARWGSLYDALYGTDAMLRSGRRRQGPGPTTRCAAPRSSPMRATCWTAPRRWRRARMSARPAYRVERGALVVTLAGGGTRRACRNPAQLVGSPGRGGGAFGRAAAAQRPAPRHPHRPLDGDRQERPGRRLPTWCWNPRCRPSWTWKTRSPSSTPTTRCWPTATGWAS